MGGMETTITSTRPGSLTWPHPPGWKRPALSGPCTRKTARTTWRISRRTTAPSLSGARTWSGRTSTTRTPRTATRCGGPGPSRPTQTWTSTTRTNLMARSTAHWTRARRSTRTGSWPASTRVCLWASTKPWPPASTTRPSSTSTMGAPPLLYTKDALLCGASRLETRSQMACMVELASRSSLPSQGMRHAAEDFFFVNNCYMSSPVAATLNWPMPSPLSSTQHHPN
mmetsp:Transcript_17674/g.28620  ORF Transcript_17674/g.28620 Transcript_17674/m.28620 type:complete len:226 (-) Transcript_17674:881-1558(-)